MLSPYRVLDLTNERGLLAGQILADLGADVIQVEPPAGSPARRLGPFAGGTQDDEYSLYWWAYTRNKRGISCDLEQPAGQALLRRLVEGADFLIESDRPGEMAARRLGYEELSAINPRLVYVSISGFGHEGPKAGYADSDLVLLAAGGPLALSGNPGRSPLRVSVAQAYHHAAGEAADGALIAHHERRRSGRGQHVDVSAQQAVANATMSLILARSINSDESGRQGGGMAFGAVRAQIIWTATDGHVSLTLGFGPAIGPFTRRLMEWICEEGGCDEATRDKDWIGYIDLLRSGAEPPSEWERVTELVATFMADKTKAELFTEARMRGLLLVPVSTIEDVAKSEQLEARGYWHELAQPPWPQPVRFPGPSVRVDQKPMQYRRNAPTLGQDNAEVYGELGLDPADLAALQVTGVI